MKKLLSTILLSLLTIDLLAQPAAGTSPQGGRQTTLQRKFSIILNNEDNAANIQRTNTQLAEANERTRSLRTRGLLSDALQTAYKTALMSKTVNATSNLLSLGISTLVDATKSKRNDWYKAAKQQCRFYKKLSSETRTDDFYALPSENGALDPQNMAFKGFGMQYYWENPQKAGEGQTVFKFFCNVRTDEEGINSIVNHGKFLVDIDELWFKPAYCGLPNDSTSRSMTKFDFDKRKNLQLNVKVKIFSSWFTNVMTLADNQQLGEFSISVKVEKDMLNEDSVFVYDPSNARHRQFVTLAGDCFMVPRSFTGTKDGENYEDTWGTGQYRVEMEFTESCDINDDYYTIRESGNARQQTENALPGKTRWDKTKWKTEWIAMQKARRSNGFWKNAWQSIVRAYKGSGWIETFTDPFTTAVAGWETQELTKWLEISKPASTGAAPQKQAAAASPTGAKLADGIR